MAQRTANKTNTANKNVNNEPVNRVKTTCVLKEITDESYVKSNGREFTVCLVTLRDLRGKELPKLTRAMKTGSVDNLTVGGEYDAYLEKYADPATGEERIGVTLGGDTNIANSSDLIAAFGF